MSRNIFNFNNNSSHDSNTGYQKEWSDQKRSSRKKRLTRLFVFLGVAFVAAGITYYINWQSYNSKLSYAMYVAANTTPEPTEIPPTPEPTPIDYESMPRELELSYRANNDTIGYLQIEGTDMDFPIVRGVDNYFYQNRNYNKESNLNGCVYMLTECDPDTSRHLVLNGPSEEEGEMFADLNEFLNEGFFYSHQYITFYTLSGKSNWQVFSVHFANQDFNYEDTDFENNVEYLAYINVFNTMSKFDTNVELEAKDQILTLATPYYSNEVGYLLVHAKHIN